VHPVIVSARTGTTAHRQDGLRAASPVTFTSVTCPQHPLAIYAAAFAVGGVSTGASLAVYASAPVLYLITITLLRWLAPRGSAERQFT